jgi:hypothetical protein
VTDFMGRVYYFDAVSLPILWGKSKGKMFPLQARCGPEFG